MDQREAGALTYRLKQLENKIKRAEILSNEIQQSILTVCSTLQNTQLDFEKLREMINQ